MVTLEILSSYIIKQESTEYDPQEKKKQFSIKQNRGEKMRQTKTKMS